MATFSQMMEASPECRWTVLGLPLKVDNDHSRETIVFDVDGEVFELPRLEAGKRDLASVERELLAFAARVKRSRRQKRKVQAIAIRCIRFRK